MEARSSMRPSRPQTVPELVERAENFTFNANIPFKHWARTAETLYQEATFALSDGDFGRAYVMLYRYSVLVLNCLPKHPQCKDAEHQRTYRSLCRRLDRVLEDLEQLKPEIKQTYEEWERMRPPGSEQRRNTKASASTYADFAARDPTLSGSARILDASEHQDLAVDLAQKELRRRDSARRATREAGIPKEQSLIRRRGGRWDNSPRTVARDVDLQSQMEAARKILDSPSTISDVDATASTSPPSDLVPHHYNYPSISKSRPVTYERSDSQTSAPPTTQPSRPPKELDNRSAQREALLSNRSPPEIPRKIALDNYQPLIPTHPSPGPADIETPSAPARPPKATIDTPIVPKKERLTFKPGAYLENGDPIRSIFLPRALRKAFLEVAEKNTREGLEMCGILCGSPVNNALFVRCLVIPDQRCTSDTCETENESALFDYCISEDLLVLGWIHTHPTQTCFMSSRDLHTQAGYQIMMPESVAIVCAPKFTPSYGVFRLTNPPGLDHILNCNHTETFHQHSIDNLYRGAEQPEGHVYESDKLPFYVHDLRTK